MEDKEIKTYQYVGLKAGLDLETLTRYVKYMTTRWKDTEEQKCRDGYAMEWAMRFLHKYEYQFSDGIGQSVLKEIDGGVL